MKQDLFSHWLVIRFDSVKFIALYRYEKPISNCRQSYFQKIHMSIYANISTNSFVEGMPDSAKNSFHQFYFQRSIFFYSICVLYLHFNFAPEKSKKNKIDIVMRV